MSDYKGELKVSIVKIRIVEAEKGLWYEDKVGEVVEAYKQTYPDGYVSYKQFPRPRGVEPSGDYDTSNVSEEEKK